MRDEKSLARRSPPPARYCSNCCRYSIGVSGVQGGRVRPTRRIMLGPIRPFLPVLGLRPSTCRSLVRPLSSPTLALGGLRQTGPVVTPGMLFGQPRAPIERVCGSNQNGRQLSGVFQHMPRRTFSIGRCTVGFLLVHSLGNDPTKGSAPKPDPAGDA